MRDGCKCCCCRMEKESKSENRPRITARIRGILERSDASDSARTSNTLTISEATTPDIGATEQ